MNSDGVRRPVVGAAIIRERRLLAARRTSPPAAAGRWELPGGKVDPGETSQQALVREIVEELGVRIEIVSWLEGSAPIADTHVLTVAIATAETWTPYPVEHDRLRWLGPDELDDVDWLEPDRPFLPQLRETLRGILPS